TQGVASLALGYALVGLSAHPCLNQKLQWIKYIEFLGIIKMMTSEYTLRSHHFIGSMLTLPFP
uniref:hypothetical protein n=1 Tax=Prevotella sp. TaxID=59823 RepID=UPI003FD7F303